MKNIYIPKQLITPKYKHYSSNSKILFSLVFCNAKSVEEIRETAKLISSIDDICLSNMQTQLKKTTEEK